MSMHRRRRAVGAWARIGCTTFDTNCGKRIFFTTLYASYTYVFAKTPYMLYRGSSHPVLMI